MSGSESPRCPSLTLSLVDQWFSTRGNVAPLVTFIMLGGNSVVTIWSRGSEVLLVSSGKRPGMHPAQQPTTKNFPAPSGSSAEAERSLEQAGPAAILFTPAFHPSAGQTAQTRASACQDPGSALPFPWSPGRALLSLEACSTQ